MLEYQSSMHYEIQGVEAADEVTCYGVFVGGPGLQDNHGGEYSPDCVEHSLSGSYFEMEQQEHCVV